MRVLAKERISDAQGSDLEQQAFFRKRLAFFQRPSRRYPHAYARAVIKIAVKRLLGSAGQPASRGWDPRGGSRNA
jgi:hypothetical protein